MKTLYFECNMGAAGDMLMSALLELVENKQDYIDKLNNVGIHNVKFSAEKSIKCGITGTHVKVTVNGTEEENHDSHDKNHMHEHMHENHDHEHHHNHHHASMADIEHIVTNLNISDKIKNDVINVYKIIANAESKVHNTSVTEIHFHEVGTMDAIADITGVCMLIDALNPDQIISSPINTGFGEVECAHGILPVPAPATELILHDIPSYSNNIEGELCTPTGAALIKYFAKSFGNKPIMTVDKTGYGMGNKDFECANCVRAFIGETYDNTNDNITEFKFNVDDMTGEEISFACKKIFEAGAVDVFTIPVFMKKNRPGILFDILLHNENSDNIVKTIFKYTSTIGIRKSECSRYILDRKENYKETEYGKIGYKASSGYDSEKFKYNADDIEKAAEKYNISPQEIKNNI